MPDEASYNEFSKFIRFFTTRVIQSVVQARLGRPVSQTCSVRPEQSDWFNTKVDELGEIAAYVRQTIMSYPPASPITVEFLLYTADGQFLPLEAWEISVDDECDPSVNIRSELYHELGTLLRSIIGAARVTPMYRYFVRKQSSESFVILYRVYEGAPLADLGTESRRLQLAALPTPHGAIHVSLSFRTRLELPPPRLEETPRLLLAGAETEYSDPSTSRDFIAARPSFSDAIPVSGGQAETLSPMSDQVFGVSESPAVSECSGTSPVPRSRFRLGRSTSSEESHSEYHERSSDCCMQMRAAAEGRKDSERPRSALFGSRLRNNSFPFAALLTQEIPATATISKRNSISFGPVETVPEENTMENRVAEGGQLDSVEDEVSESHTATNGRSSPLEGEEIDVSGSGENVMESSDESFVKVFAFASRENLGADLGLLIKEFRLAPQELSQGAPVDADLQSELQRLSAFAPQFDEFVKSVNNTPQDS